MRRLIVVPTGKPGTYKTSFWKDFIHLNVAMMTTNNALVPDPDKEPEVIASFPRQWPLCSVGLRMCSWDDKDHKAYLMGNPLIWWGGAAAVALNMIICAVYILRMRRGYQDWTDRTHTIIMI